jgi:hypothetical protein
MPTNNPQIPAAITAGDVIRSDTTNAILTVLTWLYSNVVVKTADYLATDSDYVILVDDTAGNVNITLPAALDQGKRFIVMKIKSNANHVTVTPNGADTIQGSATMTLSAQYDEAYICADGVSIWYKIAASSVGGGGGADVNAYYLVTVADVALPNSVLVAGYPFVNADIANLDYSKLTSVPARVFTVGGAITGSPSGAVVVAIWRAPFNCTVTAVRGRQTTGTGSTINAERVGVGTLSASDVTLAVTGTWTASGGLQNTAMAAGDDLAIMLQSVAGGPDQIAIQVDFTVP